jgi:hypothetical protein
LIEIGKSTMMVDIVNINRRSLLKSARTLPLMLAAPQIAQAAADAPAEKRLGR